MLAFVARNEKKISITKDFNGKLKNTLDIELVAQQMVKNFFDGKLGKLMLDSEHLAETNTDAIDDELEKFV
jgi:hypothetical protein